MAFTQLLVMIIGVGGAVAAAISLLSITLDGKDTVRGSIGKARKKELLTKGIETHGVAE